MKFEMLLWLNFLFKWIPGRIGCHARNIFMPYKHGRNVRIWEGVQIDKHSSLIIGNNVSINRGCCINANGKVTIGDNVLIGPNTMLYSQNHRYDIKDIPIYLQGYTKNPIVIGSNVWIASNVIVLPGVTIGNNVVIGAGSVVTRDISSNTLVVGVPGKEVKNI